MAARSPCRCPLILLLVLAWWSSPLGGVGLLGPGASRPAQAIARQPAGAVANTNPPAMANQATPGARQRADQGDKKLADAAALRRALARQRRVIIVCGLALVFAVFLGVVARRRERRRRSALEHELRSVQQRILRQQMNPHFVFNALSSIQYFVLNNDRVASNTYITKFSRLMRLILENSQTDWMALRDELGLIRLYLELEAMRFRDGFGYSIDVPDDEALLSQTIPAFLLQPYVENAIWHGLAPKAGSKHVRIGIASDDGRIRCLVEDDGIGRRKAAEIRARETPQRRPLGTNIAEQRLAILNDLYGRHIEVTVVDLVGREGQPAGTRVEIGLTREPWT